MIDVKEAVKVATEFVQTVFEKEKFHQITLEEVELSDDERYWFVTLGLGKIIMESPFQAIVDGGGKLSMKYKLFQINRESGKVISMKIRKND